MDGARRAAAPRAANFSGRSALHTSCTAQLFVNTSSAATVERMDRMLYRLLLVAAAADMIAAAATVDDRTLLPTDLSGIRSRDAESAVVVAFLTEGKTSIFHPLP